MALDTLQDRTEVAGFQQSAIVNYIFQEFLSSNSELKQYANKYELHPTNPALLPLAVSLQSVPISLDLKMHLFVNDTKVEFITSDNPIVKYNKYCENETRYGTMGLAAVGLKLFLPISPQFTILFYDSNVYKVGYGGRNITELSEGEINMLNKFQYLNSISNVYFKTPEQAIFITDYHNKFKSLRNNKILDIDEIPEENSPNSIVHFKQPNWNCRLNLESIKIRSHMQRIPLKERIHKRRNQELVDIAKEMNIENY